MEEEVNLLKATCDTFIKTLEEIMRIANYSGNATVHDMPIPNLNKLQSNSKNTKSHLNRTVSQENR